jgi:Fic family protein
MVYLYRKLIGGKSHYYLRASERKGMRVVARDIAYLGTDPADVQRRLDHLPAYAQEIRRANSTLKRFLSNTHYLEKARAQKPKTTPLLSSELLLQTLAAKLHYQDRFLRLDEKTRQEAYKRFLIEFAFNTTSIEGNTITLEQARKLLDEELLPKDKTLREVYDLQNTERVFFRLLEERSALTEKAIIRVHDELLERIDDRKGFRTHDVRVFRSTFEATPAAYVPTDMRLLLAWYEKHETKLHPLALGALFHHKLERIHPFADGNGRTGRMLLNLILLRHGYPPLIIPKKGRQAYLDALRRADAATLAGIETKHYSRLVELVAADLVTSYWQNFSV